MASNLSIVQYLVVQISECGPITFKKMFGDYCIYIDSKVLGFVCDDIFYVKSTKIGEENYPEIEKGYPYEGASLYPILDIENKDLLVSYINLIKSELPEKKIKKGRRSSNPISD